MQIGIDACAQEEAVGVPAVLAERRTGGRSQRGGSRLKVVSVGHSRGPAAGEGQQPKGTAASRKREEEVLHSCPPLPVVLCTWYPASYALVPFVRTDHPARCSRQRTAVIRLDPSPKADSVEASSPT
jgi:hypothetical protein